MKYILLFCLLLCGCEQQPTLAEVELHPQIVREKYLDSKDHNSDHYYFISNENQWADVSWKSSAQ